MTTFAIIGLVVVGYLIVGALIGVQAVLAGANDEEPCLEIL